MINGVRTGYYECRNSSSNKFYEVTYDPTTMKFMVRYGPIGNPGQTKDVSRDQAFIRIDEKLKKGYRLITAYPNGSPNVVSNAGGPAMGPRIQVAPAGAGQKYAFLVRNPECVSGATIRIRDVDFPVGPGGDFVPEVDDQYRFPEIATDVCRDLIEGRNVLLTGHMGTGKSSLFEQIAARAGRGIIRINCSGQMSLSSFVGHHGIRNGDTRWVDGFLPVALRHGYWLLLDEIDFADPKILSVINGVLENKGRLFLKEKDGREVLVAHPETRILATANTVGAMEEFRPMYQGTNLLNEAFLDRYRIYRVHYLPNDEELGILVAHYPNAPIDVLKKFVQGATLIRDAFEKLEIGKTMSLRGLRDWLDMAGRKDCPNLGLKASFLSRLCPDDAAAVEKIIERVF